MPPSPIIFQIGPFTLRWYGVFIVLAAVLASWIAAREARRRGEDPDHVWQALPLVLIAGIIGARLGFVLARLGDFTADPIRVFYVWEGGLSIQGGFVAGIIALLIYVRRNKLSFWRWADIGIVGVPLGQAIGRWGNYFNQEAYGEPCSDPWCIPISPERRPGAMGLTRPDGTPYPADYGAGSNYHFAPPFAYEMIWDLGMFGALLWLSRTRRIPLREGDLLLIYGVLYSLGRFFIEGIRLDSAGAGGLRFPQVFALATIVICWALFIYRHRPGSSAPLANAAPLESDLGGVSEDEWDEAGAGAATDADATADEEWDEEATDETTDDEWDEEAAAATATDEDWEEDEVAEGAAADEAPAEGETAEEPVVEGPSPSPTRGTSAPATG